MANSAPANPGSLLTMRPIKRTPMRCESDMVNLIQNSSKSSPQKPPHKPFETFNSPGLLLHSPEESLFPFFMLKNQMTESQYFSVGI